jgi:hypothetical protein
LRQGLLSVGPTFVQSPATLTAPFIRAASLTLLGNTTIPASGGNGGVSQLNAIAFQGGTLDLTNNELLLQSTPPNLAADYTTLKNAITSATAGGPGLTASSATGHLTGLALAVNSDLPESFSAARPFDGLTTDSNSILVKFTYIGDATLDGIVNIDDYLQIDDAYRTGKPATWVNGDFNYDGTINGLDYAYIDASYAAQGGPLAEEMIALHTAEFGIAYTTEFDALTGPQAVPEPGSLTVLAIGVCGLLLRRKPVRFLQR